MSDKDTYQWNVLLRAIKDRNVVPMVGNDLLMVDTPDGPQMYYRLVAEQLANGLGIPRDRLPEGFDPNDVICAYERFHGDLGKIKDRVLDIHESLKPAMPEALRLLAEIPAFNLFISTTVDSLLADAVEKVRKKRPVEMAFPDADFDDDKLQYAGSAVYHILGMATSYSRFAVTEGNMLEFMHDLMTNKEKAKNLINKLRSSHLLILGVTFPDWLARFLLRLVREGPLWNERPMTEVIVDGGRSPPDFVRFLRKFSPENTVVMTDISPVDFVRELHRRWMEKYGSTELPPPPGSEPADMASGSIFISYAREDRDAAMRLVKELTAKNLEVWVDQLNLNPGDAFNEKIRKHINNCSAFVAVLSRNTEDQQPRYWRREWYEAKEKSKHYTATDCGFIFPVVVDDSAPGGLCSLQYFQLSSAIAPGGFPPEDLVKQLDRAQKNRRKLAANR
ncbi:MAG TPA: toll/interleukin-1 receptor domain-containing protein [Opitutales bacterium]|nr:toll/interleukin-1 receptor domain-containing protein [Opitutales bacterium]